MPDPLLFVKAILLFAIHFSESKWCKRPPHKYHLLLPNSTNFDDFRSVFLFRHNHFHFSDSIGKLLRSLSVLESSLSWFLLLLIVFASCTYLHVMVLKTNCELVFVNKCLRVTFMSLYLHRVLRALLIGLVVKP